MQLVDNLVLGLATALSLQNLFYCFVGALVGTFIGVLPGIGPTATIAMLLPLTYYLSPTSSLIMLAGIYYGSQYGGSTTAILINLPGEVSSSVTAIDGYQMARQGRAGQALAIAAIGSFIAGTFATFMIAIVAVPLTAIALKFGSAEYFALILLGLVTSTALAHGSVLKAHGDDRHRHAVRTGRHRRRQRRVPLHARLRRADRRPVDRGGRAGDFRHRRDPAQSGADAGHRRRHRRDHQPDAEPG